MPNYAVGFTKTGADNVAQLAEVLSSATTRRIRWNMFDIACTAASNDGVHSYVVRRVTASATGTSVTPRPLDAAEGTALSTAEHLITADHASFASGEELYRVPMNGRATWQWNANPGYEFVTPATSASGASLGLGASSTSTYGGSIHFNE